jgi:hypothetical protein
MIGKLLCFLGCHTWKFVRIGYFVHCKNPEHDYKPAYRLVECVRCGTQDGLWFRWALEASKRQGGTL